MPHDTNFAKPASDCELPSGFKLLQGQYQIERPLICGGFGITYLARDSLERRVVVKECFPAGMCARIGAVVEPIATEHDRSCRNVLRNFLREAHLLAQAQHQGVVGVHQVFKENQTAYIAMDFVDGLDLQTVQDEQSNRLSDQMLHSILEQALCALGYLHDLGILHRDISPDNFLLDGQGTLTLVDFGAACNFENSRDSVFPAMFAVKDGYSAHELYDPNLPQRPASDLYSLGATLYFLITGEAPTNSRDRLNAILSGNPDPCTPLEEGNWALSAAFLASVDKAMSVLPGVRFQSAAEWTEALREVAPKPLASPQLAGEAPRSSATQELPALDADLNSTIATLVAQTNDDLTQGLPRSAQLSWVQPKEKPKGPRQMFNLFGEPIGDLEAWLDDQDAQTDKPKRAPPKAKTNVAPVPVDKAPNRQSTTITGRLRKIFG